MSTLTSNMRTNIPLDIGSNHNNCRLSKYMLYCHSEMDAGNLSNKNGAINRAYTDTELAHKPQQARNRKSASRASCTPQLDSTQEQENNQKAAAATASALQDILTKTDIRPPPERSWETALPETDDTGYCSSSQSSGHRKRSFSFGDRPQRRNERSQWRQEDGGTHFRSSVQFGLHFSSSQSSETENDLWRLPLEHFTSKRSGLDRKNAKMSRKMRSFYKSQDQLINQFEEIRLELDDAMENAETINQLRKRASLYAKITFFINLMLLVIKVVAVVMSGSISLISSLVDSMVDLMSGIVIWITTRAVKNTDRYVYPQGRSRLEPMSIVILSVIMSVASLQIIKESCTKIAGLSDGSSDPPIMNYITIGIASTTVVVKLILFLFCRRVPHPTVQALALDHRNDVLMNLFAIVFGYIGSKEMQAQVGVGELVYLDPVGAIAISLYIIVNWCITGWDQIKMIVGHTATTEFISKITWLCIDHHKKIQKVDTVRAFHFGNNFLVEVDIVLPPDMTLREAHDIAEPLQQKIEAQPEVERAFVHIDYEFLHHPNTEHKRV